MGIITSPTGIKRYFNECEKYERAHQVVAFSATIVKDEDLLVVTGNEEKQADQDIQSIKTI